MPNITARDIPTIIGENPYETAWILLEKKVEKKHPFFGNKFTEHGINYEDTALLLYNRETGNYFKKDTGNLKHPEYKWITGRPDAVTVNNCLVEIKCPFRKPFREIKNVEDVPRHYWGQCQVYMEMMDIECCHYVECYISPGSPKDGSVGGITYISISRDRKWWKKVLPIVKNFKKEMDSLVKLKSLDEHPIRKQELEWGEQYKI